MDYFLYGQRGSGKTLLATMEMYFDFLEGKELWSNTPLSEHLPHKYVDIRQLISESFTIPNDDKKRTLLIDETHTQMDSRTSQSQHNRMLVNFITQARKRNFRILYTSQILIGYDIRVRALTDRVIRCLPVIDRLDLGLGDDNYPEPTLFQYITYVPQEGWRVENSFTIPRGVARLFYPLYDTKEIVMPAEVVLYEDKA